MSKLTDELLGIKADKFAVGDLVKTKNTSDAYDMPWLGIITSITLLRNTEGETRNCYTVDWVDREATKILWYDWYDEDLHLVQLGANC